MAKSDLNKREFNGNYCSIECPHRGLYECDLYFEALESKSINDEDEGYDEKRIYKRCNKCIKDVVPNQNSQLIKLMEENNRLLKLNNELLQTLTKNNSSRKEIRRPNLR